MTDRAGGRQKNAVLLGMLKKLCPRTEIKRQRPFINPRQRLDISGRNVLVDAVHRSADEADLDDGTGILDEPSVRCSPARREPRGSSRHVGDRAGDEIGEGAARGKKSDSRS